MNHLTRTEVLRLLNQAITLGREARRLRNMLTGEQRVDLGDLCVLNGEHTQTPGEVTWGIEGCCDDQA